MLRVEAELALGELRLDVALSAAPGECLALAGPSGAGKTSALRVAAGLLRPTRGVVGCGDAVWLDTDGGVDIPPEERGCGFVFQDYALFPHLSAWRNVGYALPRAGRRERAVELLERFGLGGRVDARPAQLSGGERQRVALARALAAGPDALLLDEPLSALDPRTRAAAARRLSEMLRSAEVPALLVTHDFEDAAQLGDRVAVMDAGRVVQEGSASELAAKPASAFVADFTGAVVLTGTARRERSETAIDLDGGGTVTSSDPGSGRVAVSIHPWEIALEPAGRAPSGSARNRLETRVASVTALGSRVRVGLEGGQPLVAEITASSAEELAIRPGAPVVAAWKATATRVVER